MTNSIDIDDFLTRRGGHAVIDVRSPQEFAAGHIPQAINIPLFDDDERARVGTTYHQDGRDDAVLLGLEIVGLKMRPLAEQIRDASESQPIILHCWRGGMRSASVAWLMEQTGANPQVLAGGYKSFRRTAHELFGLDRRMCVLAGMTGAGKTTMLNEIEKCGEQVVDLEGLAHHRGSSFGGIGLPDQPTCEQFENKLFLQLLKLDEERPVWVEDESASIGKVRVPDAFWSGMRNSPAFFLDVNRRTRAENLVAEYGGLDSAALLEAVMRLEKKLGGQRTQEVAKLIEKGESFEVALQLLEYYDKSYKHAADKRPRDHVFVMAENSTASDVVAFSRTWKTYVA